MDKYYAANFMINICLFFFLLVSIRTIKKNDIFILFLCLFFSIFLVPFVSFDVLLNINLFLLSCFFVCRVRIKTFKMKTLRFTRENRRIMYTFFLFMVSFVFYFKNIRGWQSIITTTFVYYMISMSIWLYYRDVRYSDKVDVPVILLFFSLFTIGLLLFSKVAIVSSAIIIITYCYRKRAQFKKNRNVFLIFLITLLAITFVFYNIEMINQFIDERVLRADYTKDVKILGLSDGGRFIVWEAYLDGSVLWGKGTVELITSIPTHNLFIHLIHELGLIPGLIFGFLFLLIIFMYINRGLYLYALMLLLMCMISSFFEYSSIWVPFVWLFPLLSFGKQLKDDI